MKEKKLYVIVPYFNHTNAPVNKTNLELCLRNLYFCEHVRVIVVEGIWNKEAKLPSLGLLVHDHLRFDLASPIWVKENLINLGIQSLGDEWDYACWLDKDIHFLNPNWDIDTINKLAVHDIIQPWSRCLFLTNEYELDSALGELDQFSDDDTFGVGTNSLGKSYESGLSVMGHSGHAWAITKDFYKKIGGLFDKCIIGGGDTFQAILMTCKISNDGTEASYFGTIIPKIESFMILYLKSLNCYLEHFKGVRLGCLPGTIVHYYHGEIDKRGYTPRFTSLLNSGICLETDLTYAQNGTIKISNSKTEQLILDYFYSREEHTV